MITGKDPQLPSNELWIVNALTTEIFRVDITDHAMGILGYFPVYASRAAALADHPKIAAMDTTGQANHLRCVTLD